jgi:hypothetical protein
MDCRKSIHDHSEYRAYGTAYSLWSWGSSDQLCHDGQNFDAGLQNAILQQLDVFGHGATIDGMLRERDSHIGASRPATV